MKRDYYIVLAMSDDRTKWAWAYNYDNLNVAAVSGSR